MTTTALKDLFTAWARIVRPLGFDGLVWSAGYFHCCLFVRVREDARLYDSTLGHLTF
jgi:hypothetical protein